MFVSMRCPTGCVPPFLVTAFIRIQFCNQHSCHVMLLRGFVHEVVFDLSAQRRIEDLFFDFRVDFQFFDGLVAFLSI